MTGQVSDLILLKQWGCEAFPITSGRYFFSPVILAQRVSYWGRGRHTGAEGVILAQRASSGAEDWRRGRHTGAEGNS